MVAAIRRLLFKLWFGQKASQIKADQDEIERLRWELWGKYGD